MLNKRKLITIIIVAIVVVALATVGIIYAATNQQPTNEGTEPSGAPTPSDAGSAGDTPAPDDQFDSWDAFDEYSETARVAAQTACSWSKLTSDAILRGSYEDAGMSSELAAEYTPVWAEVFASDTVASAEISCRVSGEPGINEVTGTEGSYVWRVGVTLIYEGTWVQNATPAAQAPASATWWLTIEQETGDVIAIEQPSANDVQIRIEEES